MFEMARIVSVSRHVKLIGGIAALLLAICLPLILGSETVSAASGPKVITGYVYDVNGDPYNGVTVAVSVWNNANVKTTIIIVTYAGGFYDVYFTEGSMWDVGKQVEVIADDGIVAPITKTDTLDALGDQQVDIYYGTEIPQFGSAIGVAFATGIVGAIAVVALPRRR